MHHAVAGAGKRALRKRKFARLSVADIREVETVVRRELVCLYICVWGREWVVKMGDRDGRMRWWRRWGVHF